MPWGKYEQLCQDIREKKWTSTRPVPPFEAISKQLEGTRRICTNNCMQIKKKKSLSHTDSASLRKEMQINSWEKKWTRVQKVQLTLKITTKGLVRGLEAPGTKICASTSMNILYHPYLKRWCARKKPGLRDLHLKKKSQIEVCRWSNILEGCSPVR